jgi:hypothetical protein
MSDVFDRLVARATHRAPMVVARRPSRFEPSSAGLRASALPGTDVEGDDATGGEHHAQGEIRSAASGSARSAASPATRAARVDDEGWHDPDRDRDSDGDRSQPTTATGAVVDPPTPRPTRAVVSPPSRPRLRADTSPAGTQLATGSAPATHRSQTRTPRAERRPDATATTAAAAAAEALLALVTAPPAPRPDPALVGEPDRRRSTRESLHRKESRGLTTRTIAPETLLADHLGPALVEAGALTESEVARLVAVAPEDRDRPRRDGLTPVTIEPVEVPATGEVHLHIDHLEVRRPPAQPAPPPPARATREPAGSRAVDHTAYLDRQRRRGGPR